MGQNYLVLSEGIQAPLKQGGLTDMEPWMRFGPYGPLPPNRRSQSKRNLD